ncbi:MAG: putative ATPase [Cellvibrionaceae bacterium]|jgi:putative ATPase
MSKDLFSEHKAEQLTTVYMPLAARLRPKNLDDYIGQHHLLDTGKPLRDVIDKGQIHSMILWGPPGVGKTSLAKLLAHLIDAHFESLSAVMAGVKEIRQAVANAEFHLQNSAKRTILFIDEVHRFNKSQQDAFLPYVESGTITFIGATTENPSFELNNALLSRCRVYVLRNLDEADILSLLDRALKDKEDGLGANDFKIDDDALNLLAAAANGDARRALNLLEIASDLAVDNEISAASIAEVIGGDVRRFDKGGDIFYEQISALHKSVRGSAPDAALYWCMKMLDGGCDPLYIARRVVRMAIEDIGNADPRALQISLNAWDVQERLGSPEGELAIAQTILYLAAAPKSNAVYNAFNSAKADIANLPDYGVPMHLRNAPTQLMKQLGYGGDKGAKREKDREYRYAHNEQDAYAAGENYLPEELATKQYYHPVNRGLEIKIQEKLAFLKQLDTKSQKQRYSQKIKK